MTRLFALRYLAALVVYLRRNEAFYAGRHKETPNYPRGFGLPPYRSEIFATDVSYFEKSWNHTAHRAEGVIAYQMQRFVKAGV